MFVDGLPNRFERYPGLDRRSFDERRGHAGPTRDGVETINLSSTFDDRVDLIRRQFVHVSSLPRGRIRAPGPLSSTEGSTATGR